MGQFIAFIGLAVAAAFSYQMPILLARLFGQEIALNSLWAAAWHDSMTTRIVFLTAYIIVGTALWTAPLVYVGGLLHPHYSQRFRHRTGQVLTLLCYPLLPLFLIVQRRYQASLNEIKNRRALQALYHADFREAFVSFGEFEALLHTAQ